MKSVSCLCPTYGRPHLLEEAIESFLRQDYEGEKELVILNDMPDQKLVFDHPEVRIINILEEYEHVGEKRNHLLREAHNEIIFPWDDDDICLPHRISLSLKKMEQKRWSSFYKLRNVFLSRKNVLVSNDLNYGASYHATSAFRLDISKGYAAQNTGEDLTFEWNIRGIDGVGEETGSDELPYYIYRWGNICYHLSGYNYRGPITEKIKYMIANGKLPGGRIVLEPKWKKDYLAEAIHFFDNNLGNYRV